MELIVTHDVSDFDALASAVAAQKLYPGAQIVLGRQLGSDVREFMSLHKDRYPTLLAGDVDASRARRVVIVDVRRASRLGHVPQLRDRVVAHDSGLEVHVWDHHGPAPDDVPADFVRIEAVGSATTLLIEEMRRRDVAVDVMEATLFALGIHIDTGSLRYAATTPRDAVALGWALERGARLAVVNRYARRPFTAAQLRALTAVLGALRVESIGGSRVGVAEVAEGHSTSGLDVVTTEAFALQDVHALIACFPLRRGRLQIVGRSRAAWIDVGRVLREVGGGGHAAAGAATVGKRDAGHALQVVLSALRAAAPQPTRVRDVMSSPVRAATPDDRAATLFESLGSWHHTGVPVLQGEELVGIVSRRDIETAIARGLPDTSLARLMSRPVHTTEEDALLEDALAKMVARDVGRLPVLRAGRLVGILTRSDLLRVQYAHGRERRSGSAKP